MAKNSKTRVVQFRRKRENRTNYKKRLNLLKSGKTRLVVRKSLNHITAQLVKYSPKGDQVLVTVNSKSLEKMGWPVKGNIPSAYLTGLMIGKKAVELKEKDAVLDIGMHSHAKSTRIYALVKGALEAGLNLPCSEEVLPTDDKVQGKDIENYAKSLNEKNTDEYKSRFSKYIKTNVNPLEISKVFDDTKKKIIGA